MKATGVAAKNLIFFFYDEKEVRKKKKSEEELEEEGENVRKGKACLILANSRDSSLLVFSSSDLRLMWHCVRRTKTREINRSLCVPSVQTSITHSSATESSVGEHTVPWSDVNKNRNKNDSIIWKRRWKIKWLVHATLFSCSTKSVTHIIECALRCDVHSYTFLL